MTININEVKREIQLKAFHSWKDNNKKGFIQLATGMGKSWVMMDALSEEPATSRCIILAETRVRDNQYEIERKKYMEVTGNAVTTQPVLETYQKAYKFTDQHYDLVIADEADFLGLEYFSFFVNNTYDRILLLSATRSENVKYINKANIEVTKGQLLDDVAPLVYKHTAEEGLKTNTVRELDIVVYEHELDVNSDDCSFPYSKTKLTTGLSESRAYNLFNNRFKYVQNSQPSPWKVNSVKKWAMARARFLYGLPSKRKLSKIILSKLEGKTLILGNDLDSLYILTQNTISSRNSDELNQKLLEGISKGTINHIAADKMISRGSNIPELDNIILMSFQSSIDLLLQKLGRLRINNNLKGKVYMFVTKNTQEEVWFEKIKPTLNVYNVIYKSSKEI